MTEDLPKGLITTTGEISSKIHGLDPVDIEQIAQLWKVFSANNSLLRSGTGRRLENFFWRIWSSSRVFNSISPSTLGALFIKISDSPAGIFLLQSWDAKLKDQGGPPDPFTAPQISPLSRDGSETPPGQAGPAKPARILITERPNNKSTLTGLTAFPSLAGSGGEEPTPKQGRKKPETFLISTSEFSSKRKAAGARHRSSSASTSVDLPGYSRLSLHKSASCSEDPNQKPDSDSERPGPLEESGMPSPQPTSAHLGQETFATGSNQTLTPSRPATSIRSTPPPTGFTASSIHRHRHADDSPAKQPGPPSSLVDRDFRTRFAERRRLQLSSVSPLATPSLQQSSEHIRESRSLSPGQSLTACTFTGNNEDFIEMCSTPTAQVDDGQDISQQPDSAGSPNFAAPRHRARSQLSLMIQRLRQKEGDNIGDTVEQKNGGDSEVMETPEM
ncbi:hypothetical protein Egran_00267 [Elaphomyces granulatus]|uniref:Nitrogen regulatory protein areA GATA-like domain-containing protein n=1 Tax=Elaphomyces granulatus TaxID=519963 RepID=A0A232M6G2_9EURO|nr:hypothetical protein Egran_00267 [Elaphomyces granulatus]